MVQSAGGWLFDQVMAGWDVTVITGDHNGSRALEILGARARDLESTLALPVLGPCLQAIAVRADLYESDARVRRMVLRAFDEGMAEVRFWGGSAEDPAGGADPLSHRLSRAARAFKAHALSAAAAPAGSAPAGSAPAGSAEDIEVFRRGEIRLASPVPAG